MPFTDLVSYITKDCLLDPDQGLEMGDINKIEENHKFNRLLVSKLWGEGEA